MNRCFLTTSIPILALALLLGLCLPGPAAATVVKGLFVEDLYTSGIERTVDNGANWYSTTVGLFHWRRVGGDYPKLNVTDFWAFCIEPREFASPGSIYAYDWNILENGTTNMGGMGAARAAQLSELYGRYFPVFAPVLNGDTAGALQIATWEIVRETSGVFDVLAGTTRFRNAGNATALSLAQSYLTSLTGGGPALDNVFALTAVGVQDVVVQDNPEPGTLALLGLGLLLLAGLGRARRRRHASRAGSL